MKTLEEKKLLVKMARMLGQPVDQALIESIEREERLTKLLFKEETVVEPEPIIEETVIEEPQILIEAEPPPPPAPAFVPPVTDVVQQTVNILNTAVTANANANTIINRDFDILKRQIAEIMQKITTLSWGGGGTGIVRVFDADDFDRNSIANDKQFVTFRNGWFQMDYVNPNEIVANTTYVTSNTYQITNDDYYIGVNVASTVTITLPPAADVYTGREFYVKDESGNAGAPARFIDIYPSGSDKIDGQNYVRLQIDYGGLKFIYRDGWRVI